MVMPKVEEYNDSYDTYLFYCRHLGEPINGDLKLGYWKSLSEEVQDVIIKGLMDRLETLVEGRDLSWANYCKIQPNEAKRNFNREAWGNAALFIKAAIIPQEAHFKVDYSLRDKPESEVVAW